MENAKVTKKEVLNAIVEAVVAGVVDNNSAISQETAAISEEQKSQAESLVQLLNKFHI